MSKCDHTWVMDDSPRPACHKCFMERDAAEQADRIAAMERELAEMLRDWTEDVNKCERVERELAAVSAERDALRSELAEARALLADVTATRDSYREDYKAWRQKFTDLYNKTGGAPPTGTPGDGTR